MIIGSILGFSFVIYVWVMVRVIRYWKSVENERIEPAIRPISLLVVYRNEEGELRELLSAIEGQKVDKTQFELILVNDHSNDNSSNVVDAWRLHSEMQVKHIALSDEKKGKKRGIEEGVKAAEFDTILMCDADCVMGPDWVITMLTTTPAKFTGGPVMFKQRRGLWHSFLQLDFISLIVLGGALIKKNKPVLANGANMLFSKAAFEAVGGYAENHSIASGDDVFLLERFVQEGYDVSFAWRKEAVVRTTPPESLSSFINQRIRWAKKTKFAKGARSNFYIVGLTSFYAIYILSLVSAFITNDLVLWQMFILVFLGKTAIDCLFFSSILPFFEQQKLLKYVVLIQFIHPIYISTIAVLSLFNSYTWKHRKYSHG